MVVEEYVPNVADHQVEFVDGLLNLPFRRMAVHHLVCRLKSQSGPDDPMNHPVVHVVSNPVAIVHQHQSCPHVVYRTIRRATRRLYGRLVKFGCRDIFRRKRRCNQRDSPLVPTGRDWPCRQGSGATR